MPEFVGTSSFMPRLNENRRANDASNLRNVRIRAGEADLAESTAKRRRESMIRRALSKTILNRESVPGAAPARPAPGPTAANPTPRTAPANAAGVKATPRSSTAPTPGLRTTRFEGDAATNLARAGLGREATKFKLKDLAHEQEVAEKLFEVAIKNPEAAREFARQNGLTWSPGLDALTKNGEMAGVIKRSMARLKIMYPGEINAAKRFRELKETLLGFAEQRQKSGGRLPDPLAQAKMLTAGPEPSVAPVNVGGDLVDPETNRRVYEGYRKPTIAYGRDGKAVSVSGATATPIMVPGEDGQPGTQLVGVPKGAPTQAQTANNAEVTSARDRIIADFRANAQPGQTLADYANTKMAADPLSFQPRDPVWATAFRTASQRMTGDDQGWAAWNAMLTTPKAAPAPAPTAAADAANPASPQPGGNGIAIPPSPTTLDDALFEADGPRPFVGPSSSARARTTLDRVGPRPADMPPYPPGNEPTVAETLPNAGIAETGLPPSTATPTVPPVFRPSRFSTDPQPAVPNNQSRGSGTADDPFRVATEDEFAVIRSGEFFINPADGSIRRKR